MRYKIVADSSANLYEINDENFTSVPLKIITDEREYVDVKGTDLAEMVDYLQGYKGRSTTSCPNVHDWLEAFGDADVIFGVAITSNLSGSYASAVRAREEYLAEHPDVMQEIEQKVREKYGLVEASDASDAADVPDVPDVPDKDAKQQ